MSTPVAIVVAAAIIAGALFVSILVAFRWEVTTARQGHRFAWIGGPAAS